MKRTIITLILCLALGCVCMAQQNNGSAPASKEDVERMFQAMNTHDMMLQMIDAMSKPMHQMVHDQFMRDKDKLPPDFEARMNKMMDDMMKQMPFDEMLQASVPVYQKHFTKGEIDALVAFYASPIGQKALREMPAIMGEAMQSMMPIMSRQMETMNARIQQEIADMIKSMNKSGQNPPAIRN